MANIQNELNNIKNATFGKEVRGSIHDGIDAINKEVESTTERQVDLESTFNQLVINAGNSNAEIVDARVKADGTSYTKLGDRLDSFDSQLEQNMNKINEQFNTIVSEVGSFGAAPSLDDNAPYIQEALNQTGIVLISKPGTYLTDGLVIKSNTILLLGKDVTLKLKNGANKYLIVNEHWKKSETIWDENIHIIGGNFDFNKVNNTENLGSIAHGGFIGCGIVLNHIRNFSIRNINKLTNASKYCILYGNAINGKYENIRVENGSDGIHAQCNVKNIEIDNIEGVTGDNMLPFTLGDYTRFTLADEGDIENITITNIYGDEDIPQMDMIRFIGSGKNNNNKIKNIKIKNVRGNTGDKPLIWFMDTDTPDDNIYLKNTVVENIEIDNIDKVNSDNYLIALTSKISNIKINNIRYDGDISTQLFYFNNKIENLEFNNLIVNGSLTKQLTLFKTDGQANLPLLDFNRLNISLTNESSYLSNLIDLRMYGKNQIINFNNCKIETPNSYLISCEQANGYNAINSISLNNTIFKGGHIYNITGEYIHSFYLNNSNITTTSVGNIGVNGIINQFNSKVEPPISHWKEVTYNTGWQKHPSAGLKYSKNGLYVNIEGMCQTTGVEITDNKITTLPNGYKPTTDIYLPVCYQNRTNENIESNIIKISTEGIVSLLFNINNSVGILGFSVKYMYKTQ